MSDRLEIKPGGDDLGAFLLKAHAGDIEFELFDPFGKKEREPFSSEPHTRPPFGLPLLNTAPAGFMRNKT